MRPATSTIVACARTHNDPYVYSNGNRPVGAASTAVLPGPPACFPQRASRAATAARSHPHATASGSWACRPSLPSLGGGASGSGGSSRQQQLWRLRRPAGCSGPLPEHQLHPCWLGACNHNRVRPSLLLRSSLDWLVFTCWPDLLALPALRCSPASLSVGIPNTHTSASHLTARALPSMTQLSSSHV